MFGYFIHLIFSCYTLLLMIRIIGSWIPSFQTMHFMLFVTRFTDPYLNIFRKVIPPIGGMLDVSPILGFLALQFSEQILLKFFGSL